MNNKKLFDVVLIIFLYVGICTFPVAVLAKNDLAYFIVEALFALACLLFILIYVNRHEYLKPELGRFNLINLLLFIPVLVITFSNFIYAWIFKEPIEPVFNIYNLPQIIHITILVIVEELIFRYLLLGNLTHEKKIIRILISSGIFALCHLTHFFVSFNPYDLIIVAYAFGLGMVLGLIFTYTNSLIPCIAIHLLFNILNDFLFTHLYGVQNALWYYLINVIIAVVIALYLTAVFFLKFNKKPSKSWMN